MPPLRVAVIGAGQMGEHHLRTYSNLKGVELVGVVDAGRSGLPVPPGDVGEMARAICRLCDADGLTESLIAEGCARVAEDLDIKRIVDRLEELYGVDESHVKR